MYVGRYECDLVCSISPPVCLFVCTYIYMCASDCVRQVNDLISHRCRANAGLAGSVDIFVVIVVALVVIIAFAAAVAVVVVVDMTCEQYR